MLSTALLFSTLSISKTTEKMYLNQMLKYSGTSEVIVQPNTQNFNTPFFAPLDDTHLDEMIDYSVNATRTLAIYEGSNLENKTVSLLGLEYNSLELIYNPSFVSSSDESFTGQKIIIGQGDAETYNLNIGDNFSLYINGQEYDFLIYGITKNEGFFQYSENSFNAVVPINTIATIYGYDGLINSIYYKTTEDTKVSTLIDELFVLYSEYTVRSTISSQQVNANMSQLTTSFSLMLVLVIFISIFIINTSFKVITVERLPVIGTFRSIGATKAKTNTILFGESLIFGIIGGSLGILLGFGIITVMMNNISNIVVLSDSSLSSQMVYTASDIIISVFSAIIISVIGSLAPIMKTSKISVKDILLKNVNKLKKKSNKKTITGFVLITLTLLIIKYYPIFPSIFVGAILLIFLVFGIIMVIPFITKIFVYFFARINRVLFGNIGILSAKNIQSSKNIINNITLLVIGLGSLLMINTVSSSVMNEIGNVFGTADFELVFTHTKTDDDVVNRLSNIDGVESVYPYYQATNVRYIEGSNTINNIYGVEADKYFDYWRSDFIGNEEEIKAALDDGRNIIPTQALKNSLGLEVGDYMTLSLLGKDVEYKVIGFVSTLINNGQIAYVSSNYLKADMNLVNYSEIVIQTNKDEEIVINNISEEFDKDIYGIESMKKMQEINRSDNGAFFDLLNGFSIITMIIGSFGVFNNFLVSYLNRKRNLALYRSVGMSKKQTFKMLLIETFDTGLIGGITAILASFLLINLAEFILEAMNLPIKMNIDWKTFVIAFVSSIAISVIAGLSPIIKSSKINLVKEIKYE